MKTDILIFSPHPDDAELGCSGSIILAAKQGISISIVDMTEGEKSSIFNAKIRNKEKEKASEKLKILTRISLHIPDTKILLNEEYLIKIVNLLRELKPKIVLAPFYNDRHPDHETAGYLIKKSCFYSGVSKIGNGNPFRPERLFFYMIHSPFVPSFVVDISDVWKNKIDVIKTYKSQFTPNKNNLKTAINQNDFIKFVEARAIYFGKMIGANYGEPFFSLSPVPVKNFSNLVSDNKTMGTVLTLNT